MITKLKALFLALLFPTLYLLIRLLTQYPFLWAAQSGERARAPGLDDALLLARVKDALMRYTPWMLITAAVIAVSLLCILLSRSPGGLPAAVGTGRLKGRGIVWRIMALGVGLNVGLTLLICLLPIPASWVTAHADSVSQPLAAGGIWVQILCTVFVVPVAEEVVFRGLSYNFLARGFSPGMALLWQGVLFAGFHGTKLQLVYAFLAALALGAVYRWQGTLRAPVLLHMTFNAVSLLGIPVPQDTVLCYLLLLVSGGITALTLFSIYSGGVKQGKTL